MHSIYYSQLLFLGYPWFVLFNSLLNTSIPSSTKFCNISEVNTTVFCALVPSSLPVVSSIFCIFRYAPLPILQHLLPPLPHLHVLCSWFIMCPRNVFSSGSKSVYTYFLHCSLFAYLWFASLSSTIKGFREIVYVFCSTISFDFSSNSCCDFCFAFSISPHFYYFYFISGIIRVRSNFQVFFIYSFLFSSLHNSHFTY